MMDLSDTNRVTVQLIPGARHDILHHSPARTDLALAEWLEEQIPEKE